MDTKFRFELSNPILFRVRASATGCWAVKAFIEKLALEPKEGQL
jgi:hypothetical protein